MQHTLPIGYLLDKRYKIEKVLAQGGFGITYEAHNQLLDLKVCVKELFISGNSTRGASNSVLSQNIEGFSFSDFKNRFIEEARQLARFHHPNIVRVNDVVLENNTAYLVMDYIEGLTLKAIVEQQGPFPYSEASKLIGQLLSAVEEVHNKGMLHRDIKPENVLLTKQGQVVLIDFGSARAFMEGKTQSHTTFLTPGYAPIEQYSNLYKRGAYTDIYALGATMYFLLTGKKPLAATDRNLEKLVAPNILNPKLSEQVSSVVLLAMEMMPADRFQSVSDFRLAFTQLKAFRDKQKTEAVKPLSPDSESEETKFVPEVIKSPEVKPKEKVKKKEPKTDKIADKPEAEKTWDKRLLFLLLLPVLLMVWRPWAGGGVNDGISALGSTEVVVDMTDVNNSEAEKEAKAAEEKETAYTENIEKADAAYVEEDYETAKDYYEAALELKPQDLHALEQIIEINEFFEKETAYTENIEKADAAYDKEDYETAKDYYKAALKLKPNESYPKEQLKGIDKIINPRINIEMVYVAGGTFSMGCSSEQSYCDGDESPVHQVTLSSYRIGKYEVTQAQWQAIMGNNPSKFSGCDNCPVEQVSWYEVQEFISKLNAKTGKRYRLPTEAEWEFAARGGNQSKGFKFAGSNDLSAVAWYDDNSGDETHPVGTKKGNELGIYDMSGNVWEWCSDWYGAYSFSSQSNPKGPSSSAWRLLRGGSWNYFTGFCRVSDRNYYSPSYRYFNFGFRLAL